MATPDEWDVQTLLDLAREKSKKNRSTLITAINDLYSGDDLLLTDKDRAIMEDIIRILIYDVEMSVRRTLSSYFATNEEAPHDIVVLLANDRIEVAHPILLQSEVLKDEDLMEIIYHRTMEHRTAIADRRSISEKVSDALVEHGDETVIERLLQNRGACISEHTMDRLVAESRKVGRYRRPLVLRNDLSPALAKRLYWGVSAALRAHLVAHYDLDVDELDEAIETVTKNVLEEDGIEEARADTAKPETDPDEGISHQDLIEALEHGSVFVFLDGFARLAELRQPLVRRLLFEEGGEGLAILCKALGISKRDFGRIFLYFRRGRVGEHKVEHDETSAALSFFDRIKQPTAERVLRRWRRDEDYLDALRKVEGRQSGEDNRPPPNPDDGATRIRLIRNR